MGNKVMITADCTCDLGDELVKKHNVHLFPLYITIGGKSYADQVEITPTQLYDIFYKTGELPKTTATNVSEYSEVFKKFVDEGYDVVHLSLGSKLSATHQFSSIAASEFDGRVFSVDSCNLSTGVGLLVLKACDMRDQGLSAKEIAENLRAMTDKSHASFVLDRLDFMRAGGRCSTIAVLGANLLKLKPSIEVVTEKNGDMTVGKKYRGANFSKVLVDYAKDQIAKYDNIDTSRCFITHSEAKQEYIDAVMAYLKEIDIFDEIYVTTASCVISSHCGPNTLGILFMTK